MGLQKLNIWKFLITALFSFLLEIKKNRLAKIRLQFDLIFNETAKCFQNIFITKKSIKKPDMKIFLN